MIVTNLAQDQTSKPQSKSGAAGNASQDRGGCFDLSLNGAPQVTGSERLAGLAKAHVPMGALRLLRVVMSAFFSEDYLLKGEEKKYQSAKIPCSLISVSGVAWRLKSLINCSSFI